MPKKYWNAPRDLETIPRSILRKVKPLPPSSSYPFLSGDTFKSFCAFEFDGLGNLHLNSDIDSRFVKSDFIFAHAFPDSTAAMNLYQNLHVTGLESFSEYSLIIHNGDQIPSEEEMLFLSKLFKRIYSVNWLGDRKIAIPLPIGLENRSKRRNGVPRDFAKMVSAGLPDWVNRDIELLVCFSMHTNVTERSAALDICAEIKGVQIFLDPMTPKEYRKLVLRSKYVLSPPGNGPDCHRTWESIYLGAVPIVHQSFWPDFEMQLPVEVVKDWNQIEDIVRKPSSLTPSALAIPDLWIQ